MRYTIVCGLEEAEVAAKVEALLRAGWKLNGPLSFAASATRFGFAQSLYLEANNAPTPHAYEKSVAST